MADQDFQIKVVTTADTTGLRQTRDEIQRVGQEGDKATSNLGARFTREFGSAAGFGYIIARVINGIAAETNKVTAELDKQGEHLIELSQKWTEMAKAATSSEDVAKIAASGVKEIDALGKAIEKAAAPGQLSLGATMVDELVKRFKNLGREVEDAKGPNEELQDALLNGLALTKQQMIENQAEAINLGREFQKAFEANQAKPLADALADLAREMYKAENAQNALTTAELKTEAGIKRYNELATAIANASRQTDLLIAADARRQRQAEETAKAAAKRQAEADSFMAGALKTASPQVQRALLNEDVARQTGDEMFQKSAEAFKRGFTPEQRQEYEGLTGGGMQKLIDAINDLRIEQQKQTALWR